MCRMIALMNGELSQMAAAEPRKFETEVIKKGILLYEAEDHGVDQQGGRRLDNRRVVWWRAEMELFAKEIMPAFR